MLMNPGSFQCAKTFLSSSAVEALNKSGQPVVHFFIPDKCPNKSPLQCLPNLPSEEDIEKRLTACLSSPPEPSLSSLQKGKEAISPVTPTGSPNLHIGIPSGPWSTAFIAQAATSKNHPALVDTEVRCSVRKKEQLKGYKHNKSTCEDQNCLGYLKNPPTLSPNVIRNLGETYCKMDGETLTEKALVNKRKVLPPSGKAPGKAKAGTNKESENEDKTKKANKKPPRK
ncbi:unnamed protein product [Urochloa humidicola]